MTSNSQKMQNAVTVQIKMEKTLVEKFKELISNPKSPFEKYSHIVRYLIINDIGIDKLKERYE